MIPEEEKINTGRPTLASVVQGERTQVARTHKYQNRERSTGREHQTSAEGPLKYLAEYWSAYAYEDTTLPNARERAPEGTEGTILGLPEG